MLILVKANKGLHFLFIENAALWIEAEILFFLEKIEPFDSAQDKLQARQFLLLKKVERPNESQIYRRFFNTILIS